MKAHQFISVLESTGYAYKDLLKDFLREQKRGPEYVGQLQRKLLGLIREKEADVDRAVKVRDLMFWHLQYARKKTI